MDASDKSVNITDYEQIDGGFEFKLIRFLGKQLNFTPIVVNGNLSFGNYINGSWTGIVGMANRSVIHMD